MADELELQESVVESDGGASQEVAPLDSQEVEPQQPKPAVPAEPDYSKLDLTKIPQYREVQSKMEQRIARMEQEATQARQEAEKARREAIELRRAGMDDFDRAQDEKREALERVQYLEGTLQQRLQMEQQREQEYAAMSFIQKTVADITAKTGAPESAIDTSTPDAAWRSGLDWMIAHPKTAAPALVAEDVDEQPDPVDIGGGGSQTGAARTRARIAQLEKQKAPTSEVYKLFV